MISVLFRDYPRVRVAKQPKKRLPTNSFDFACNVIDYSTLTSGDIIEPAREQLFGKLVYRKIPLDDRCFSKVY